MSAKKTPVFILAGGLGTRLSEETSDKPMVEIGGIPILLHIMRNYYSHGFNDFVICAGYKSWEIKRYFLDYEFRHQHLEIDHRVNLHERASSIGINAHQEKWRVRVVDTGTNSMTGARVGRALKIVDPNTEIKNFALTYGDGLCDANLLNEYEAHLTHQKIGTILAVRPIARFGELSVSDDNSVQKFSEKPQSAQGLINGGFFFFKRNFDKYLSQDPALVLEQQPLIQLSLANF